MPAPAHRLAIVLPGARPDDGLHALAALVRPANRLPGVEMFCEAGVQAMLDHLETEGPDLVVMRWPPADAAAAGLAFCTLEAARRKAPEIAVALLDAPQGLALPAGCDALPLAGALRVPGRRLDDAWPALWSAAGPRRAAPADGWTPAVSVIVRSMDRPSLGAALQSIAWQTFGDVETVVVNAAGPSHGDLGRMVDNERVRFVSDAQGSALPRARAANVGLRAARGRWLMFLDDDDILLPDHLSKLMQRLQHKPQVVAAYGDVDFGQQGPQGWVSRQVFASEFDPVRLSYENFLPIHAVLFRRECLGGGLQFDEQLQLLEDWDFWLACAAQGPFERVPGISARYLAGTDGGSNVFVASDLASRSLARVLGKWQQRLPASHWVGIVERLLQAQRLEQHAQQRLAASLDERDSLRSVLQARDVEIANLRQLVDTLKAQASRQPEAPQSQRESAATPPAPATLAARSRAWAKRWTKPR